MAPDRESIRIGMQLRFAAPPDRRDPAPGCAGINTAIVRLGGMR